MLRLIFLLAAVLAAPASVAQEVKIGFVNTERILRESGPAQRAGKKLEAEFAKKQAEIQRMEKRRRPTAMTRGISS